MGNVLRGKNIIIGISGGIAAYKTPQLVRLLKNKGHMSGLFSLKVLPIL